MKKVAISTINLYQIIIVGILNSILGTSKICRYEITCSEYAKQQINEKGVLKGSVLAFKRLLSCHPFGKIDK